MLLTLPDPEVTVGPTWAEELVTALGLIDSHDHTTGKGAQIVAASLSINSDLSFGSNDAYALRSVRFTPQASALVASDDLGCLYAVGTNLYYNNAAGAAVQITSGSGLNVSGAGAITASVISSYPYTVTTGDANIILLIDTASARTINLPAATNAMFVMIKDRVGSAQTNNISVVPNGTDTIETLAATFKIDENFGQRGFVSDAVANWYVV